MKNLVKLFCVISLAVLGGLCFLLSLATALYYNREYPIACLAYFVVVIAAILTFSKVMFDRDMNTK